jgi:hypothetical protein
VSRSPSSRLPTDDGGQQDLAHLAALAGDGELHAAFLAREHVRPRQGDDLAPFAYANI